MELQPLPKNFMVLTEELRKKYGLHPKAKLKDLPVKVLAEILPEEQLVAMVVLDYFGNQWDALKLANPELFKKIDHGQWDLNLSHLAQKRVCGLPNKKGECPYPFEDDMDFWVKTRGLKLKK